MFRVQGLPSGAQDSGLLGLRGKGFGSPKTPIMENQMEKNMENEMETGII